MKNYFLKQYGLRLLVLVGLAWLEGSAALELWQIPWGKGIDGTPLSLKWGLATLLLVSLSLAVLIFLSLPAWNAERYRVMVSKFTALRSRMGVARWLVILAAILLPCWLFGYTVYGVLLTGTSLHLLAWALAAGLAGFLLTKDPQELLDWNGFLSGLLITGFGFTLAYAFTDVTGYPFSLYWSEGNRMWDYSVLFGRERYLYPENQSIYAYIDIGRQIVWGLPFILPHVSIAGFRFWNALMFILPYLLLGWIVMKTRHSGTAIWLLAGAWAYLYLNLGAVYTTLIISAILVALGWKRAFWFAIPLLVLAGFFASLSRWTWVFAPAIWIGMLEFCDASLENGKPGRKIWVRSFVLVLAGLLGGFLNPIKNSLGNWVYLIFQPEMIPVATTPTASVQANPTATLVTSDLPVIAATATPVQAGDIIQNWITDQPLLWYRLFPNSTYPPGILLGLLIAVGPILILLVYLFVTRRWHLSTWQKVGLFGPLLAFLSVGLVASVKIGGGSNLHNLDMFIITLLFAAVLAWHRGLGSDLLAKDAAQPTWLRFILVLLVVIPAMQPVTGLQPSPARLDYGKISGLLSPDFPQVTENDVQNILSTIRDSVAAAQANGDVLFMDQRQLLTFGYVRDVPLVADYEKKYMMDLALSGNTAFFAGYYRDLADRRFSLIITEPLLINYESVSSKNFAEENNIWVEWVSEPTLCFYQPFVTYVDVGIQLLVPREDISHCSPYLEMVQP